MCELKKKQFV